MKPLLALLLVSTALAGCMETSAPVGTFDGDAALALVSDIVYDGDALRVRSPGTDGHLDTADWLLSQMTVAGWDARADPFTGTDYNGLPKGAVESYTTGRYCTDSDRAELETMQFSNLYATLPGGEGHVVLAAHWDSKEDASDAEGPIPGANDGASGVAVLLELQRHIQSQGIQLPFDLTIAFFDGEDGFEDCHPLAGSLWAARESRLGDVSQLILLDMVGDPTAKFIRESQSVASDGALVDALWAKGTELRPDNFVSTKRSIVDDHVPFLEEGIQAVDIIDAGHARTFQSYWHTSKDTPDNLSADMLGAIGDLLLYALTDPDVQVLLQD